MAWARFAIILFSGWIASGCVSTAGSGSRLFSLQPDAVATASAEEAEDEPDAESEDTDALDAWLQALTYRSPSYQLELPQRSNRLSQALQTALGLQGTPYRRGGTSENGLDCSGLVYVSYGAAGIKLPRTSQEQFRATRRIERHELRPGDLVFFRTGRIRGRQVDHVGIYLGNDKFLHAPRRGKPVSVASLNHRYWQQRYVGAGRASDEALPSFSTAELTAMAEQQEQPPLPSSPQDTLLPTAQHGAQATVTSPAVSPPRASRTFGNKPPRQSKAARAAKTKFSTAASRAQPKVAATASATQASSATTPPKALAKVNKKSPPSSQTTSAQKSSKTTAAQTRPDARQANAPGAVRAATAPARNAKAPAPTAAKPSSAKPKSQAGELASRPAG